MNVTTQPEVKIVSEQPKDTVPVRVYRELRPVPDEMHWATAVLRGYMEEEALYYVPKVDEFASQHHVKQIHALHPDCTLVYL
jgi:hypothetical protein